MLPWIGSQGAASGLPPVNVAAVGGAAAGEIDVTVTSPKEPVGWTLDAVVAQAIHDRDAGVLPTHFVPEIEGLAPTVDGDTIVTLTGCATGEDYVVAAWTRWLRPDGTKAYGASLTTPIVAAT